MKAMSSSGKNPMDGKVEVDETFVGGQDEKVLGRNEGKKKIMVVAVERKGRGVSRLYGRVVETAARKLLKQFMLDHIAADAEVRTDRWSGYNGLESEFPKLVQQKSEKEELPAAPQDNHDVQGLAQGHPPFGVPLTALY